MKLSKFVEIFKDDNDWNEKAIIGFLAFAAMTITMLADLMTGYFGKDLVIKEFIYNSFLILVLGCFGISGMEKIFKKPTEKHDNN
jgi:hypothetical protein